MQNFMAEMDIQVLERDGRVITLLSRVVDGERRKIDTDHIDMDPGAALIMAERLTDAAFAADTGLKPIGPTLKAELVKKHRDKLIPRITMMFNSMRESKEVSHKKLATEIVDVVCSEVFS